MIRATNWQIQSGFALLLTIVIISVVLAVGLSLLDITVKQISISITGRDSEVAFNGAQGATECAQMIVRDIDFLNEGAREVSVSCFGQTPSDLSVADSFDSGNTSFYSFRTDWSNGSQDLCSDVDIYIMDARTVTGGYTTNFGGALQGLAGETCSEGDVCTVVFARGYNRACNELDSLRTVQRELTISF